MRDAFLAIGNIAVVSYLIPLILFIYRYARYSPWTISYIGRTLMGEKLAFTAVIGLILFGVFLHDYPGREYVRLAVYLAVLAFLWWDYINLVRTQRSARGSGPGKNRVRWEHFWHTLSRKDD